MALNFLKNPYILAGAGGIALLGATCHQYATNVSKKTGFHHKDKDPTLRIIEKDVAIPKMMIESCKKKECRAQQVAFRECVAKTENYTWARVMTFYTCKPEKDAMMNCMNQYFLDYDYYLETKAMYVRDKAIHQVSKIMKKDRENIKAAIVENTELEADFTDNAKKYHSAALEYFRKTGDIDAYDNLLVSRYEEATLRKEKLQKQAVSVT